MEAKDNPYIVYLAPPEFHELLSEYENYVEWCRKEIDERQKALAERVLAKLRRADHVCLDEVEEEEPTLRERLLTATCSNHLENTSTPPCYTGKPCAQYSIAQPPDIKCFRTQFATNIDLVILLYLYRSVSVCSLKLEPSL